VRTVSVDSRADRDIATEFGPHAGLGAKAFFGCGRIHRDRCCQPCKLLFAAAEGCKQCARAAVEQDHVDPVELLRGGEYDVVSWALDGARMGNQTAWVQGYLAGKGADPSIRTTRPTGTGIGCGSLHDAACSPYHFRQPYKLFSAAFDGCRDCVRAYIEDELLDPNVRSESGEFNALSWALAGASKGQDANWVQGFLEARGVTVPASGTAHPSRVLTTKEIYELFGKGVVLYNKMLTAQGRRQLHPY
jgi:hypothetical protein